MGCNLVDCQKTIVSEDIRDRKFSRGSRGVVVVDGIIWGMGKKLSGKFEMLNELLGKCAVEW